jgi:hypothetical protein
VRYFLDTEFIERGPYAPIDLISIGVVAEDGREFYAESDQVDLASANDWVKNNVIPFLTGPRMSRQEIAAGLIAFCAVARTPDDLRPEFWGYYCDYDWVVVCQLFGAMIDLPKGWPMFCMDLKQLAVSLSDPRLPEQTGEDGTEHNALADARWNARVYRWLIQYADLG